PSRRRMPAAWRWRRTDSSASPGSSAGCGPLCRESRSASVLPNEGSPGRTPGEPVPLLLLGGLLGLLELVAGLGQHLHGAGADGLVQRGLLRLGGGLLLLLLGQLDAVGLQDGVGLLEGELVEGPHLLGLGRGADLLALLLLVLGLDRRRRAARHDRR